MFNKNNWKEPIDKQDLIYVILNGLLSAILAGILAGSVNYLLALVNVSIDVGFLILVLIIPWRVRNAFYNNHISYALIAIISLFLGFFISYCTPTIITAIALQNNAFLYNFQEPYFYLLFLIEPFVDIYIGFGLGNALGIIFGILNIIITCYAFYYTYKSVRNRR